MRERADGRGVQKCDVGVTLGFVLDVLMRLREAPSISFNDVLVMRRSQVCLIFVNELKIIPTDVKTKIPTDVKTAEVATRLLAGGFAQSRSRHRR